MRIGIVRRGYSASGGAESYSIRFAQALMQEGHTPVLFTAGDWPADQWPGKIVKIAGNSPAEFSAALLRTKPECDVLFSLERLTACDVYRAGDGVHRAWLRRRAEYEPRWKSALRKWNPKHGELLALEAELFRTNHTRHVIANSHMVKKEIHQAFNYPTVSVIYNGLPAGAFHLPHEFRVPLRESLGVKRDDFLILFAGSGWERKGLRFALEAFAKLPASLNTHLVIAGRGRIPNPQPARTHFTGPVRNLPEWLAAADAFILPTIYDPFSNACLEAHAAGLPVITTAANGFAEILTEHATGSIINRPDDVEALAAAICFWADPARRAQAHPAILEHAAEFTIEKNLQQTLQILFHSLNSGHG